MLLVNRLVSLKGVINRILWAASCNSTAIGLSGLLIIGAAHASASKLLADGSSPELYACAKQALDRFQWPRDLLVALEEGNLQQASDALDCWS